MLIKELRIKQIVGTRSGVSAKTGQPWKILDLLVSWQEESSFGETMENTLQCRMLSSFKEELAIAMQKAGTPFPGILRFAASEYNGRFYNDIILSSKALQ